MIRTMFFAGGAIAAIGMSGGVAVASGVDVLLLRDDVNGVITTGAFDDDTVSVVNTNQRVFEGELGGLVPGNPNLGDEPGFRALAGDFDGGSWGFNVLSTPQKWNGSTLADSPIGFDLSFGPASVTVGAGGATGFSIPVSAGGFDDHLDMALLAGDPDPGADGVYVLEFEAFSLDSTGASDLGASDPFWFVLGRGVGDDQIDPVVDYVQQNLVPAPGALALFGAVGLAAARRRR